MSLYPLYIPRAEQLSTQEESPSFTKIKSSYPTSLPNEVKFLKQVAGIDNLPRQIGTDEQPQDPFGKWLLSQRSLPLSLQETLDQIFQTSDSPEGLQNMQVFHIAEGGQIKWSEATAKVNRTFRLALAFQNQAGDDVFISSGIDLHSETQFLQVMGWDTQRSGFNFYERKDKNWLWAGNSHDALNVATRGKGPFCGHINGAPNMKELKLPWSHWSSQSASIGVDIFNPGHPFTQSDLFTKKIGAENLETRIKAAINRWSDERIRMGVQPTTQTVPQLSHFMRQLLSTTNVNLTSSPTESASIDADTQVRLPVTFFLNLEALQSIGLNLGPKPIKVSGSLYLESLKKYGFKLKTKGFEQAGDTHFAFLVPEPAFEDTNLLQKC